MTKLKKIEVLPDSRLIHKISYICGTQQMTVFYKGRGFFSKKRKVYSEVSFVSFQEIINSVSVGKALMQYLKGQAAA